MSADLSFDQLVGLYLDNEMTAEQFNLLCEQIAGDADLRRRFLKLSALDFAIAHHTDHRDRQNMIETDFGLGEQESEEDSIFELYKTIQAKPVKQVGRQLNMREVLSLTGYLAGQALRDQRVIKFLVAASLLIGVVIYISLRGPGESPNTNGNATNNTPQARESAQPAAMVPVATLTFERDAVWDRRPGQDLYAGQRFTLNQGFAEVKTVSGAVVIIQAPATIGFLNNDNAIRLHAGKLVATCETDASKGFIVRTQHMDITDLGTRFGVDASDHHTTLVSVFEGEIEVAVPAEEVIKPVGLFAGQSAYAGNDSELVTRDTIELETFADLLPRYVTLPHTGTGLSAGQADRAWSIVRIDGEDLATPLHPVVERNRADRSTLPSPAQWIVWNPPAKAEKQAEVYLFETLVNLPADLDPTTASLELQYSADNRLNAVIVNGHRVPLASTDTEADNSFDTRRHRIRDHLLPGENIICFELYNTPKPGGSNPRNTVGLRLDWHYLASDTPDWRGTTHR